MKKAFMIVLALLISVAFVTTVFAQTPAPKQAATPDKPVKVEKPKTKGFKGEVTKVEAMMVTAKDKKGDKAFNVADAKFKGYKDATEIKAGDKVAIKYYEKDGKNIATLVAMVKKPKPPKTEAPKTEPKPATK